MTQAIDTAVNNDLAMVKLAREIAMDIQPLANILKSHSITNETWSELQQSARFNMLLSSEVEAWQTALNTHERVKLKSAAMLEEWLPELYRRMNDPEQAMPAIIEAGKMLSRLAGLGIAEVNGVVGERFSIHINMGPRVDGADSATNFVKDVTRPQIIEGEAERVK